MSAYSVMIREKVPVAAQSGMAELPELSNRLRAYQADCVRFGLGAGRFGLFLDTGLGKTLIEHEWANQIIRRENRPLLILTPLAVAKQQARMAEEFGYQASVIREARDVKAGSEICICNYDRLHLLRPEDFCGVGLDEGSMLKGDGKMAKAVTDAFAAHRWRMDATATPAPNDHVELGQAAHFLGIMPPSEMRMRWFRIDHGSSGRWELMPHGEADFWRWVATWARMASHPRDLGHPEEGFETPGVEIIRHHVKGSAETMLKGPLWGTTAATVSMSATGMHDIKRQTAGGRAELIAGLVAAEPEENWVIWCDTDLESEAMRRALEQIDADRTIEVRGSQKLEVKEERLERFSVDGGWMITKPSIAGFGLNWQHAARMACVGRTYSYEMWYQAVSRLDRAGQTRVVKAHLAIAEGEEVIAAVLERKAKQHGRMQEQMALAMRRESEAGGSPVLLGAYEPAHRGKLPAWIGSGEVECLADSHTSKSALYHGDCVEVLSQFPDGCIDFSVYSPPFAEVFVYSDSAADMGNCGSDEAFQLQYRFLCEELYRVTRPGRMAAVHCKDLRNLLGMHGVAGLRDFPALLREAHESAGWLYWGKKVIWCDPVKEQAMTKGARLNYTTDLLRDATEVMGGLPDYLLLFKRPATNPEEESRVKPVVHTAEEFPLKQWQEWASDVWGYLPFGDEVRRTEILKSGGKAPGDVKHVCPLPLPITERAVSMWSMRGETVLSPFGGIGSEPVTAIKLGRKEVAVELKESYYKQMRENVEGVAAQGSLFGG